MKTFAVMVIGLSTATLAACSTESLPDEGRMDEAAPRGVSELELSALLAPEPGAAAADYAASTSRYRLFGVQLSQVPSESSATLADISTWATRNLRVGELLGRNLQVAAITLEGLELKGVEGSQLLRPGQDVRLRVIQHRFDRTAVHRGRHQWRVDAGAVTQIRGRYGLGAQVDQVNVFSEPALRLNQLQERGLLARLGLHEGDLLFSMDGRPLAPSDLEALADRVAEPGHTVRLRVYREAGFQELTFVVERQ